MPRALVVVFPTIHNITPRVAEKTRALADAGYLAFCADFYGQEVTADNPGPPLAKELRADNALYRQRLFATISAAQSLEGAADLPVLAIGFCMGGQAVLELARAGADLAAVASFHGLLGSAEPADSNTRIIPRILVCHGDRDPMVPRAQVAAFMQEMDRCGADWHLHIYARAVHGFTDPANDEKPVDAVGYDSSADRQSWAAMHSLFEEVLES
jgi:dienelactone hydrolase